MACRKPCKIGSDPGFGFRSRGDTLCDVEALRTGHRCAGRADCGLDAIL